MMRYLLIICALFSLFGCRKPIPSPIVYDQDLTEEVTRTVLTYSTKLKYKKHLHLDDSFATYKKETVNIRLDYYTQDLLDVCEGRTLLVDVVEGLLKQLNTNQLLVCYNNYCPYTADNLEINIDFESYYGKYTDPLLLGFISLRGGVASYNAFDTKDECNDCKHHRSEYYSQSRMYVEYERMGEKLYKPPPPKDIPTLLEEAKYTF